METGDIIPTAPAAGILTYKGEPLAFHQLIAMPKGGRPAIGITDEAGHFVMGTNDTGDGASVGTHPGAVSYVGPPSTDPEEGMTVFTTPPPPKVKIPPKYTNPETSGLTVEIPQSGNTEIRIDLQ